MTVENLFQWIASINDRPYFSCLTEFCPWTFDEAYITGKYLAKNVWLFVYAVRMSATPVGSEWGIAELGQEVAPTLHKVAINEKSIAESTGALN